MSVYRYTSLLVLLVIACNPDSTEDGKLLPIYGQETDTLTRTPLVTSFTASVAPTSSTNTFTLNIDDPTVAPTVIDMGTTTNASYFYLDGTASDSTRLISGGTLPLTASSWSGYELPIFIGRTDVFSRPPGTLSFAPGKNPPAAIVANSVLWLTTTTSDGYIESDGYDLLYWEQSTPPQNLRYLGCDNPPCVLQNLVVTANHLALGVGDDFGLSVDTSSGTLLNADKPEGLTNWGDLAGGQVVSDTDSNQYLIGATRSSSPSLSALLIDNTGVLYYRALTAKRQGAATAFVAGRGVIVAAGSSSATALELLEEGGTTFSSLGDYPPNEVTGAAMVPLDAATVALVGGRNADQTAATSKSYALGCTSNCATQDLGAAFNLPELVTAQSFTSRDTTWVVGEGSDGTTHIYRYTQDGFVEISLRTPRLFATPLVLPTRALAIIGGTDTTGAALADFEVLMP